MLRFWPECAFFPHKEPRYDFFLIFYRFKLIFDIQDGFKLLCWWRSESPWLFRGAETVSKESESESIEIISECQRITQLDYNKFLNGIGMFLSSFPNSYICNPLASTSSWVSTWNLHFVLRLWPEAQHRKEKEKKSEKLISLKGEFNFVWFSIWLMLNFLAVAFGFILIRTQFLPRGSPSLSWRCFQVAFSGSLWGLLGPRQTRGLL